MLAAVACLYASCLYASVVSVLQSSLSHIHSMVQSSNWKSVQAVLLVECRPCNDHKLLRGTTWCLICSLVCGANMPNGYTCVVMRSAACGGRMFKQKLTSLTNATSKLKLTSNPMMPQLRSVENWRLEWTLWIWLHVVAVATCGFMGCMWLPSQHVVALAICGSLHCMWLSVCIWLPWVHVVVACGCCISESFRV